MVKTSKNSKNPEPLKPRAGLLLSDGFLSTLAFKTKESAKLGFGIVGNLLRNGTMAVMANQSVGRLVFDLHGILLHDFIGVQVSFRVVASGNGKTC